MNLIMWLFLTPGKFHIKAYKKMKNIQIVNTEIHKVKIHVNKFTLTVWQFFQCAWKRQKRKVKNINEKRWKQKTFFLAFFGAVSSWFSVQVEDSAAVDDKKIIQG